jgi:hypothetical protein
MSIKKTQKQYFEEIIGMLDSEEHKDFLRGRIEALAKKTADRKPTAEQKKAVECGEAVVAFMTPSTLYTVTDLMRTVPIFSEMEDVTFQYVNAIIKRLVTDGEIVRVVEKGRAYFRLA